MTSPSQPDPGLTYEQAMAMVLAAEAASSDGEVSTVTAGLAQAVIAARESVLQWVLNMLLPAWRGTDVYSGTAVQEFTVQAAEYMATAQTTVAESAAAAQTQILAAMGINAPFGITDPVDVRGAVEFAGDGTITVSRDTARVAYESGLQVIDLDEDATTEAMFNRPARTQRYLESKGLDAGEARAQAEQRMLTLVDDNLMLAQRLAEAEIVAQAAANEPRIIGTRRVIHPELSRTGTCGLCIAASDRIYKVTELRPIHDRCNCTTAPVTEDYDPADDLNAVDLSRLYNDAGKSTSGAALKRTRYKVNEHGELGPTLIPAKPYKPRGARRAAPAAGDNRAAGRQLVGAASGGRGSRVLRDDTKAPTPAGGRGGGGGGGGDGGGPRSMDDWNDDRLPPEIRRHILDGDANGGGHRSDSTAPRKTLFPATWDDYTALSAVSRTLDNPYTTSDDHDHLRDPNIVNLYGMVDGVRIAVRTARDGSVITAHPLDGDGVFRNGKKIGDPRKALPLGSVRNVPLPDGPQSAR